MKNNDMFMFHLMCVYIKNKYYCHALIKKGFIHAFANIPFFLNSPPFFDNLHLLKRR